MRRPRRRRYGPSYIIDQHSPEAFLLTTWLAGEADTVFVLEEGATLRNVIIGADQGEGVYCLGSCTLEFVWFEDVCEDAISIKGDGTANIIGGGAFHASDKVIQHNGCGHVNIVNFYAEDYGKVYRSCGNCSGNCARTVHMEGTTAVDGGELMGINPNLGDKVRLLTTIDCFKPNSTVLTRTLRPPTPTTVTRASSARPMRAATRPTVTASLPSRASARRIPFFDAVAAKDRKIFLVHIFICAHMRIQVYYYA
jgi:hypothetical protein